MFARQTWTLCKKTLLIVFMRHWLGTLIRAFLAPIIFMFFISYAKNFFVPPSDFGIGTPTPIRSLGDAVAASAGGRNTVAFVDNGFTGGDISNVIDQLSQPIRAQGKTVTTLSNEIDLLTTCRSSIRGVSPCFAAVSFISSPTEGSGGVWNYTIRADGSFGERIYVNTQTNDAEIYVLPLQKAVDSAIASINGTVSLPDTIMEYPYTSETAEERQRNITRLYMGSLIDILAVAYFIGIVGICYQLTGHMAEERERGMSQLLEAMMPNRRRWLPQVARLLSIHISFDILYFPSWIIMGLIVAGLNYPHSNAGILVGYFILAGLALSSWSIAFASLFKKAQLSGITVTIASIILAIIIQVIPPPSTGAAVILSLLFPPMNFTLFIIYMAYWQRQVLAADLTQPPPGAPWQISGYVFFIFCIIQTLVYPAIGAWIEQFLFGTASKSRQLNYSSDQTAETVQISSLSKYYPPNWFHRTIGSRFSKSPREGVLAVDSIDVTVLRGQIMVLLGANGSGKSTTLDLLAGLQKPTGGSIAMDATGGIGLCPQKNVLWDELTVQEHVRIFNQLKTTTKIDSKSDIARLVDDCDLAQKLNARSETLSGGQKRKLQLAMMLTGGSRICLLDEVSSGLDPLSRRKIWDIVLAERGKRSMILTTHFLDEADLLSDDITILSRGKLVAKGSAVELKHHLGGGYRVRIYHENEKTLPKTLQDVPRQVLHDQTVYFRPDSAAAAHFIAEIERHGVRDYQVNGPTIEDVFLKLAEEVKDELEKDRRPSPAESKQPDVDGLNLRITSDQALKLVPGKQLSFLGQTWVLFRKRLTILRRNSWPYLVAFLIPVVAAALVTLFLKGFSALSCSPQDQTSSSEIESLGSMMANRTLIPIGPSSQNPRGYLTKLHPALSSSLRQVNTLADMENYVSKRYGAVQPGGLFLGDNPTIAWRGDYNLYYSVITMNLLDTSLLQIPIYTNFQSFDVPWAPSAGKSLQLILYFGLAFSAFPGFFALYINNERLRNVRALHYSNGVRAGPLWLAYTSFDFLIVLVVSALCIIIFSGATSALYGPGYLFVVFALFGLSATLMSYVVSLFATGQLATFAFAAGGQCIFFLIYFIAYMCIITYSPAADVDSNVNTANYAIAFFFPAGNLLRSLLLTFNEFSVLCRGDQRASYPGDMLVYGGPILYLLIQSGLFLTFLILWDSGWKPAFLRKTHRTEHIEETEDIDPDVYAEAARVHDSKDDLRVSHVTKAFGPNVAVQDLSFGVPRDEIFALLGPNGAGKSTTIGVIRGDTRPSDKRSDVHIMDTSIVHHRAAARGNLGVCPQFDAMDQMTAVEHLRFYARARGVRDVEYNVEQVVHAVGLAPFKSRMAGKLSGGNKRKLSLGIALMGNPSVLLLDEPSSGMDAASKRVMWRTLNSVSEGRSLILTTHSMEEADALADRAGIMAKRMLALGTSDQLRKKHGDAHHVHLVHKDAPYTSNEDMNAIKAFINRTFAGATTEERVFHGQLRFSVPNDRTAFQDDDQSISSSGNDVDGKKGAMSTVRPAGGSSISALFAQLEANKEQLGFGYYSVSQATLDQVFLSIITKHNVIEENYAREHQKKDSAWVKIKRGLYKVYHNA